ncbi:MAG: hypothetical protein KDJ34_01500 [Candidatus Competibacteraceae bacterium]|nr:hypothetical protein [Candidatus Competibacteraceae bacterium]
MPDLEAFSSGSAWPDQETRMGGTVFSCSPRYLNKRLGNSSVASASSNYNQSMEVPIRTGVSTLASFLFANPDMKEYKTMTLKPILMATSFTLLLSNVAWAADVKDMATDAAKDQASKMAQEQATDMVKDKAGAMMPKPDAASAMKVAPGGASGAMEGAAGAAALQKAGGGAMTDMAKDQAMEMGKDKAMDMGKDQATEAAKKMVK